MPTVRSSRCWLVDSKRVGAVDDVWPSLRKYFQRVWERGGQEGCAQRGVSQGAGAARARPMYGK